MSFYGALNRLTKKQGGTERCVSKHRKRVREKEEGEEEMVKEAVSVLTNSNIKNTRRDRFAGHSRLAMTIINNGIM